MQWARLVLDYLRVLVWPVVVVIVLVRFREPLHALLGRLRKADALGASLDFETGIEEAARSFPSTPEPSGATSNQEQHDGSKPSVRANRERQIDLSQQTVPNGVPFDQETLEILLSLATTDPYGAVRGAWDGILAMSEWAADELGLSSENMLGIKERPPVFTLIDYLVEDELISRDVYNTIKELLALVRSAGDAQASGTKISILGATTFVTTAFRVAAAIVDAVAAAKASKGPSEGATSRGTG